MATEAQRRATAKYDAAHTKQVHLKLNISTDADIIEHLSKQESVQGYIKRLIREDAKIRCKDCRYGIVAMMDKSYTFCKRPKRTQDTHKSDDSCEYAERK